VVVAGPNGSGKSSVAPSLLRDTMRVLQYVNADVIAEGKLTQVTRVIDSAKWREFTRGASDETR
jgi:predicted ABC-type ATPase